LHIGLNTFAGVVGVSAGLFDATPLSSLIRAEPAAAPAFLFGCLGLGYFLWVAINDLPTAWASYSSVSAPISRPLTARERDEREEAALRATGILPGDPSLYPGRPDLAEEAQFATVVANDRPIDPGSPAGGPE
jgi:hypothetical protein